MGEPSIELHFRGRSMRIGIPQQSIPVPLSTLMRRAGVPLNTRCGERGVCESCLVQPTHGRFCNMQSNCDVDGRWSGTIRACQHTVHPAPAARIEIPDRSLLEHRASVVTDFHQPALSRFDPIWRADADFDGCQWNARVSTGHVSQPLGVAVDVGTTTVVVLLIDLASGETIAQASDFNQQIRFGDDVLTRITLASDPPMRDELRRVLVEETIVPLIRQAAGTVEVDVGSVVCGAVCGNTTMLHLLAGEDPTPLGVMPFSPVFLEHRMLGGDLLWPWGRASGIAPVMHLMPGCSAYVGADISGGMIATPLLVSPTPAILLDVGTNGEMVLRGRDGRLIGCATAAGPAFEGSGLSSGVRAVEGAVTHVRIDPSSHQFKLDQIGRGRPIGLCGSFYVDFIAEAHAAGLIDDDGRFTAASIGRDPTRFLRTECDGMSMRIVRGMGGIDLRVTERDIARIQSAKAAIAAGLCTMLSDVGLTPTDVHTLYLAGGFGMHLDVTRAIAMGLLPGFKPSQVRVTGNSALAGAWMCLCSTDALRDAIAVSQHLRVLELNAHPEFENLYIDMLRLPPVA